MGRIYWTEEEEEILKKMAIAGVPVDDMCRVFKSRTEAAIRSKLRKMGFSAPRVKPEIDWETVQAMEI